MRTVTPIQSTEEQFPSLTPSSSSRALAKQQQQNTIWGQKSTKELVIKISFKNLNTFHFSS